MEWVLFPAYVYWYKSYLQLNFNSLQKKKNIYITYFTIYNELSYNNCIFKIFMNIDIILQAFKKSYD